MKSVELCNYYINQDKGLILVEIQRNMVEVHYLINAKKDTVHLVPKSRISDIDWTLINSYSL